MPRNLLRLAVAIVLVAGVSLAIANSTGPPASETGAPAIGSIPAENTCRACHLGNPLNSNGLLEILDVPSVYKPDSVYLLTVRLSSSATSGATNRKWGFEITAVKASDGTAIGTLKTSNADTLDTIIKPGSGFWASRFYIEHNSAGTRTGAASPVSWTLRWVAPPASGATTRALFYAAGNAADGDTHNTGDFIYTASASSLPPARVSTLASLDFGSVIAGAGAQQNLPVSNSTPSPADTLRYSLSAPAGFTAPGGDFTAAGGAGPNNHTISMSTGSTGVQAGNLIVASNDPVTPSRAVALSGSVLDHAQPSLDAAATVLSDSVDLGAVPQGSTRDTTVLVFNRGYNPLRARLDVTGANITGGAGRFSIVGGFSPALVAAQPETVKVRFNAAGADTDSTYSAQLTFTCADEPIPGATALPSLGVTLTALVTPSTSSLPHASTFSSLDFGSVIVGASAQQTLPVSNSSPAPADTLRYSLSAPAGFTAPGGDFTAAAGAGPNNHILSMSTGSTGSPAGNLIVASNDPVTPSLAVALSGMVVDHAQPSLDAAATVLSDSVDLGAVPQGSTRDTTVLVFNRGYNPLRARLDVTGANITGGAGRFSIVGGFSPALVAAQPETVKVRFDGVGAITDSAYSAQLTFTCADELIPGGIALPSLDVTLTALVTPSLVAVDRGDLPSATRLLPVRPNPVQGRTALGFDLGRSGAVALDLFDVRGRRVRSLARGPLEPGRYHFEWDGTDDGGAPLPAGIYFLRLVASGLDVSERVAMFH